MLEMSMAPQMEMQVNPALLHLAHLLALPGMELHQAIQQELVANPSLEELEIEEQPCAICGGAIVDGLCLKCMVSSPSAGDTGPTLAQTEGDTDPLLFVATPLSLSEGLLLDLYASLPEADHIIATAVMGSLDEQGFLADEPSDIATTLNVPLERVEHVVQYVRDLGPPGIATRDMRECLLAQLADLDEQGMGCPNATAIVDQYMDELGAHRYKQIARNLAIAPEEVEEAHHFIQTHLWPYPVQAVRDSAQQQASFSPDQTRYSSPDLAIAEKEGAFLVEVLNSPRRMLRINPLYQDMARNTASLDEEERAHVQEYVARTRVFLSNLRQRESTLKQIGEAIVARQQAFLRHGVRHLAPMTRAEIADELELHESTISRAVADKTVLLPDKTLLPLSEFFVSARSVQDVMRELIDNEAEPLSDQELARVLSEHGYPVARRTVAKYRTQMKILPSHMR